MLTLRLCASLTLALLTSGCGGSGVALHRSDRNSADVFELEAQFEGKAAAFGSSHEWYVPTTGVYRIERRLRGVETVALYDGAAITHQSRDRISRTEGSNEMLRAIGRRHVISEAPAIFAVQRFLSGTHDPNFIVDERRGGRSFDVAFRLVDEGVDTHVRYHVDVRGRSSLDEARAEEVFKPLTGALVGVLKQSAPGTRPHFGERAYWFGPRLGQAKAVTALESWGYDPFADTPRRVTGAAARAAARYTTIYRLPRSFLPRPYAGESGALFPGIGTILPIDIEVQTSRRSGDFLPGLPSNARGRPLTLENGARAKVYVQEYRLGDHAGVIADIVVGDTVCFVRGLVDLRTFLAAARMLRPL